MAFPIVSYGFTAHQYLFQVGAWHLMGNAPAVHQQHVTACWPFWGAARVCLQLPPSPPRLVATTLLPLLPPQIYPSSQKPSLKKMTTAMQRGMALSALVYVAVGACGYSAFGSK